MQEEWIGELVDDQDRDALRDICATVGKALASLDEEKQGG